MKSIDAYRDVLKELDKYESPTFSVRDFNYFYPKAVSRYIDINYRQLDVIMKDTQDISSMLLLGAPLTIQADGTVTLPSDFRHLLSLKVTVRFKKDVASFRATQSYSFWPERMKSGQKGFRNRSAYGRPNFRRYYYEISATTLKILFDSEYVEFVTASANAELDYILQPTDPYINPTEGVDLDQEGNNRTLTFNSAATRNYVYYEIANLCRAIFLENIESPRTGIALQESAAQA